MSAPAAAPGAAGDGALGDGALGDGALGGAILAELDAYCDAAPRGASRVEDFGALTLFVREEAGFPYYARPTAGHHEAPGVADVRKVRERQRELGVPQTLEWVHESAPTLRAAAEGAGLAVEAHPLMVLDESVPVPPADGIRLLEAEHPLLAAVLAVPHLAFGNPGTEVGETGPADVPFMAAQLTADGWVARTAERMRAGQTALAAYVQDGVPLCCGSHQPVGDMSEVTGVGTLPSARRRGLAGRVTAALVADARARGVRTVFLAAQSEDVARVYARLGFRPTATAMTAGPA